MGPKPNRTHVLPDLFDYRSGRASHCTTVPRESRVSTQIFAKPLFPECLDLGNTQAPAILFWDVEVIGALRVDPVCQGLLLTHPADPRCRGFRRYLAPAPIQKHQQPLEIVRHACSPSSRLLGNTWNQSNQVCAFHVPGLSIKSPLPQPHHSLLEFGESKGILTTGVRTVLELLESGDHHEQ